MRRSLVVVGWLLVPGLLLLGARMHNPIHFISAILLTVALWPVTTRSGEILWEGPTISVRRFWRFVPLDADWVEAAVVTPPILKRQSLVLKLKRPLHLSRYVYCRLSPGTVCDAWALVHERDWEPGAKPGHDKP
ncbi:MAG: DUF333 domain-containing protein [Acidobacteria bacterium]|nr:DUF333 domain-containing protein [Acidobacteriota bacterium]MCI0659109.1 DUF333 domain-containing protein [Acidobacteriota bacterium]